MLNNVNNWFGVAEYNEVIEGLQNGKRRAGFGSYEEVDILNDDTFGRIGIVEFFEELDHEGEILTMEELEDLDKQFNWTEKVHGNTYNHSGYLEREMDFKLFVSEDTSDVVAFFAVHIGLDIRGGYTKSIAVKYDYIEGFDEHLMRSLEVATAKFQVEGKEYSVHVDAEPCSEYLYVYISDESTDEFEGNYDRETVDLDVYDREDFKESLMEYLKENEIDFDEGSIEIY